MRLLLHWLLSAITLLLVAHLVPGFVVTGFVAALLAALVIGLINATLGLFLKVLTFPLTIVTFGIFLLVINALMLKMAAAIVPGFEVRRLRARVRGRAADFHPQHDLAMGAEAGAARIRNNCMWHLAAGI